MHDFNVKVGRGDSLPVSVYIRNDWPTLTNAGRGLASVNLSLADARRLSRELTAALADAETYGKDRA